MSDETFRRRTLQDLATLAAHQQAAREAARQRLLDKVRLVVRDLVARGQRVDLSAIMRAAKLSFSVVRKIAEEEGAEIKHGGPRPLQHNMQSSSRIAALDVLDRGMSQGAAARKHDITRQSVAWGVRQERARRAKENKP